MKKHVVKRIVAIAHAASKIEEGDYSVTMSVEGEDEITQLSNTLGSTIRGQLEYNRSVLQGIKVPLFVVDHHCNITFINGPMLAILGKDAQNVDGMSVSKLFYSNNGGESQTDKVLQYGKARDGLLRFTRGDGVEFPLHYEISPLHDAQGKVAGAIGVMIDLTKEEQDKARIKAYGDNLRHVGTEVTKVAQKVAEAAEAVARDMGEISNSMDDSANQTLSLATAMEQMNATVLEVANSAGQVAQASEEANKVAQVGGQEVRSTVEETMEVSERAGRLAESLNDLAVKAESIGQVMGVINDIADQTNLLALNAAIEAARAGEAGRGFAVVADEVRKLAEKTMQATKEVENAIRDIQHSTHHAVEEMSETKNLVDRATERTSGAGKTLQNIVGQFDHITQMVQGIAAASEQQSATSDEINQGVSHISSLAGETSNRVQNANQSMQEVTRMALQLTELVERFKE